MKLRVSISLTLMFPLASVCAFEIDDKFSINGTLAGAIQCQGVSGTAHDESSCGFALPFRPEFSFAPGANDQIFFKLGFAAGNGLNNDTPFAIPPWAADLEDDLKNINGRNRDHLLTAWYKHSFELAGDNRLGITVGIIDATDYLLENAFTNDEFTQFMNTAMDSVYLLPSYDIGAALQWDHGPWSVHAVVMQVGENNDGNKFTFSGLQAGYRVTNRLGNGNYRITVVQDSKDFLDPGGTQMEDRAGVALSIDQEFGRIFAGWLRIGWQTNDAAVDFKALYSGGVDIDGTAWGRDQDTIGLACAYVVGGNLDLDKMLVSEAYYRWRLTELLHLTGDLQYQADDYRTGRAATGWVYGLRAVVGF